jgi:exodeoxyribonuclease V alpha subunit
MSMVTNKLFADFMEELWNSEIDYNKIYPNKQKEPVYIKMQQNIVFLGDVDQLQAIGKGNILNNLIESNCIPITKLTKQMRNKGKLSTAITKIRINEKPEYDEEECKFIKINCEEHCKIKLMQELEKLLKIYSFDDIMIITPTNHNVKYFTSDVRKMINKNFIDENTNSKDFEIGDYIMMKKNIYSFILNELNQSIKTTESKKDECKNCPGCKKCIAIKTNGNSDLFNGMIGKVVAIEQDPLTEEKQYYKITFSEKNSNIISYFSVLYISDFVRLSYVNTVHKYQGSENKVAIILLTEKDRSMINKNLLYTAISRASKKCIIISDSMTHENAFKRNQIRISQLSDIIKNTFESDKNYDE